MAIKLLKGPIYALFLSRVLIFSSDAAAEIGTTCIGDTNAPRKIIFLSGITHDVGPSETWRLAKFRNWVKTILSEGIFSDKPYFEEQLTQLGHTLKIQFALLESDQFCPGSLTARCWVGDQPAAIATTYASIIKAARACFPVVDQSFELLGFSNGGYHVGRVVMQCLSPTPRKAYAFGSAGDIKLAAFADLSGCVERFVLAIGDQDITNARARTFAQEMQSHRVNIRFVEFFGGHEMPIDVLKTELLNEKN